VQGQAEDAQRRDGERPLAGRSTVSQRRRLRAWQSPARFLPQNAPARSCARSRPDSTVEASTVAQAREVLRPLFPQWHPQFAWRAPVCERCTPVSTTLEETLKEANGEKVSLLYCLRCSCHGESPQRDFRDLLDKDRLVTSDTSYYALPRCASSPYADCLRGSMSVVQRGGTNGSSGSSALLGTNVRASSTVTRCSARRTTSSSSTWTTSQIATASSASPSRSG
jgi:hypothetical protein